MNRRFLFLGVFMFAFCGMTQDAYARRGIPIFWGSGEKMTEMGTLPPEVAQAVAGELGTHVTVAFVHHRAHLFFLDLWTWNGRHVIHSGDKYWEPTAAEWQNLIGETPSARYGKPILYRIPLFPALLIVVVAGYAGQRRFFKSEQEQLEALMNDKRYQRSIETIFGSRDDEDSDTAITTLDEQRFLNAKNQLIGEGVAADPAEANLRKLADAILDNTNSHIDAYLGAASQLDQEGEWDKSAEIYSHVISTLPADDERMIYARNCLAAVNDKRSASGTE